jgi:hypothetical protein
MTVYARRDGVGIGHCMVMDTTVNVFLGLHVRRLAVHGTYRYETTFHRCEVYSAFSNAIENTPPSAYVSPIL